MRDAPLARGGNDILTGRTLFVGCPFGARPDCSAGFGAVTFAFFDCLDPTSFSLSETDAAFRLLELTARFCDIIGTTYGVKQGLKERCGNRIDRRAMIAIQLRDATRPRDHRSSINRDVAAGASCKLCP